MCRSAVDILGIGWSKPNKIGGRKMNKTTIDVVVVKEE
jgi:hypothetical protein